MINLRQPKYWAGILILLGGVVAFPLSREKVEATVPYNNTRANLDSSGNQANAYSQISGDVSMSKDGRYIAFSSAASNLVAGDTNGKHDIFVKDKTTGTTTRVNVSSGGSQATTDTAESIISGNGQFVLFASDSTNLIASDTNNKVDLFLRDLQAGTTEAISSTPGGTQGNNHSGAIGFDISADGRFVVFSSSATNLVAGDTNGVDDVFIKDRKLNTLQLVSKSSGGTLGNASSRRPSVSCDGAYISFTSYSTNLVASDSNGVSDVFLVERIGGDSIKNVTLAGNGDVGSNDPALISCDSSSLVFTSSATNLVAGDTNSREDIFTYNILAETFERISVSTAGVQASFHSDHPSISADGKYVAFDSGASNLVSGDTNATSDVFLRDRIGGTTERVSMRTASTQASGGSFMSSISADGQFVVYNSFDAGLVGSDTNGFEDVFVSETGLDPCSL